MLMKHRIGRWSRAAQARARVGVAVLALLLAGATTQADPLAGSPGQWATQFDRTYAPGIRAMVRFRDELIVAGSFSGVNGVPSANLVRLRHGVWVPFAQQPSGTVYALQVLRDTLYVGGSFQTVGNLNVSNIARWDGTSWGTMAGGTDGMVEAMTVQDGRLVIGGGFTQASGRSAKMVARWTGSQWDSIGNRHSFLNVYALAVHQGRLVVGGWGTTLGAPPGAGGLAEWNNGQWALLAGGTDGVVFTLLSQGTWLYVGGSFGMVGSTPASGIACLQGATWTSPGAGLEVYPGYGGGVAYSLLPLSPSGAGIAVGGNFAYAGGQPARNVARWDGRAWSELGGGCNESVRALGTDDLDLYAAGDFDEAGGNSAAGLARLDGSAWVPIGNGLDSTPWAMAMHAGKLYVAGDFIHAGGRQANGLAAWDGSGWSSFVPGLAPTPYFLGIKALASYNNELYAAGDFSSLAGFNFKSIARWDGAQWAQVADGITSGASSGRVYSLASMGGFLYAAGEFTQAGGLAGTNNIARWNGSAWERLGSEAANGVNFRVRAMLVLGDTLFVAGEFTSAAGIAARGIALWHGTSWAAVPGTPTGTGLTVRALGTFQGGLVAFWQDASGYTVRRWNGVGWSQLGGNFTGTVESFAEHDGSLYATGSFSSVGGVQGFASLARWNGTSWSPVGSGLNYWSGTVLLSANDPGDQASSLWLGGNFRTVDGVPSSCLARLDTDPVTGFDPVALTAPAGLSVWPNPSRAESRIRFALPSAGAYAVEIFDVAGRLRRVIERSAGAAGEHIESWDGRDGAGARVGAGIYFVRVTSGARHATGRLVRVD